MSKLERAERSYIERYCAFHGLPSERFTAHLFKRSLHAPLRWIWPVAGLLIKNRFEIDQQCVATVGRFHSRKEINEELVEFSYHPRNRNFARRVLSQRISTHRLRRALRNLPE